MDQSWQDTSSTQQASPIIPYPKLPSIYAKHILLLITGILVIAGSTFVGFLIGKNQISSQALSIQPRVLPTSTVETPTPPLDNATGSSYSYTDSSSTYHDTKGYFYLLTSSGDPSDENFGQCRFRLVKTLVPTADFSDAERILDFIDCVGNPEKIISVSPNGNIFIFSKQRDDGIGIASTNRDRPEIKYHGFNIPNENTKIYWTSEGISFQGYPSSPWLGVEPERNKVGLVKIPLEDMTN